MTSGIVTQREIPLKSQLTNSEGSREAQCTHIPGTCGSRERYQLESKPREKYQVKSQLKLIGSKKAKGHHIPGTSRERYQLESKPRNP